MGYVAQTPVTPKILDIRSTSGMAMPPPCKMDTTSPKVGLLVTLKNETATTVIPKKASARK